MTRAFSRQKQKKEPIYRQLQLLKKKKKQVTRATIGDSKVYVNATVSDLIGESSGRSH